MTLASFLIFLIPVLIGSLIVHLLWPARKGTVLLLKLSLGVGLGLGISSVLYFLALIVSPGRIHMQVVEVVLLVILAIATFVRERGQKWDTFHFPALSRLQSGLIAAAAIAFGILTLIFISLALARPQGGFDAWSIWNRAARFIYRDPENWRAALSPELHWQNHADYPLLVPLNVAWGWQAVGTETLRVPMLQGALFVLASLGLMFAAVALTRTVGQASLATLVLMCTPTFVLAGSGMVADVPVMYFMLASSLLIFLSLTLQNPVLLALSGFMAGLAAWTKNEGLLFVAVSPVALILTNRKDLWRSLRVYLAGLAIPLAVVLYFKSIAPASDLFQDGNGSAFAKITDLSRYWIILKALGENVLAFGGWPFSILIGLAIYSLVMRTSLSANSQRGTYTIAAMILLQFLGYFAIYVLSPHDLEWLLATSLYRLILQLYPTGIFLLFSIISDPETIFGYA